jgi:hypothetical protein
MEASVIRREVKIQKPFCLLDGKGVGQLCFPLVDFSALVHGVDVWG